MLILIYILLSFMNHVSGLTLNPTVNIKKIIKKIYLQTYISHKARGWITETFAGVRTTTH